MESAAQTRPERKRADGQNGSYAQDEPLNGLQHCTANVYRPWSAIVQPTWNWVEASFASATGTMADRYTNEQALETTRKHRRRRRARREDSRIPAATETKGSEADLKSATDHSKPDEEEEEEQGEWEDRKQMLLSTISQLAGLFAMTQATFLAVFVPQLCPPVDYTSPWFDLQPSEEPHLCTPEENVDWYNCTPFNNFCLVFNAFTFVYMCAAQAFYWKREQWIIDIFDYTDKKPRAVIKKELEAWPAVRKQLDFFNRRSNFYATSAITFFFINGVTSGYLTIGQFPIGARTYTGFATNIMLVGSKIAGHFTVIRAAVEAMDAPSMFMTESTKFNIIEKEYKSKHNPDGSMKPIDQEDLKLSDFRQGLRHRAFAVQAAFANKGRKIPDTEMDKEGANKGEKETADAAV